MGEGVRVKLTAEMRQDFGDTESLNLPERTFESKETTSDD